MVNITQVLSLFNDDDACVPLKKFVSWFLTLFLAKKLDCKLAVLGDGGVGKVV